MEADPAAGGFRPIRLGPQSSHTCGGDGLQSLCLGCRLTEAARLMSGRGAVGLAIASSSVGVAFRCADGEDT